jgi:hypothetical protein
MSYVSNIANSMLSHAENVCVLGPEIYTAIAEWEKREIPAAIVLISIEEVCSYEKNSFVDQVPVELVQAAVTRNFQTWLVHGGEVRAMAA